MRGAWIVASVAATLCMLSPQAAQADDDALPGFWLLASS
jgi:hypothetical protein